MVPTIRHERAKLDDVELHYAAAGDPDAPLIILLHGFPEFWYGWKPLLAGLHDAFHVVIPDQRGYGLSEKPDDVEAYRIERLVSDVTGLVEHLGEDRFTLAGHDWGGIVAWVLAATRPERLDRLVVVNAPHPAIFARERRENPDQRSASEYIDLLVSPMAEAALAANGHARLFDGLRTESGEEWLDEEDRAAYREAWSRPGAMSGMVDWYRAAEPGSGAAAELPTVRVPTLVIWGERDRFLLPGNLEGLDERVEDLEVVRVPDAGHWILHEKPAFVSRSIRSFLARDR